MLDSLRYRFLYGGTLRAGPGEIHWQVNDYAAEADYAIMRDPPDRTCDDGYLALKDPILLCAAGKTHPGTFVGYTADADLQPIVQVSMDGGDSAACDRTYLLSNANLQEGARFPAKIAEPPQLCFLPGTLITRPAGETAVEALAIGDPILAADGRTIPVRWIGRQTIVVAFGLPAGRLPVVIAAGALAPGLPQRDLRVTADHAIILDGIAVEAGALVNGSSIRRIARAELGERFTVFHVETEEHEVILAEGAPAETFMDSIPRAEFDNAAEHAALYDEAPIEEMPLPRAMSRRQVPREIQARIAARAAALAQEE